MSENKNHPQAGESRIEIDYDRIDVASIMTQIKKNVADKPSPAPENASLSPSGPPPDIDAGGEPAQSNSRARKILLKIMKPFAPVIKALILPVHEEMRQTVLTLDRTNRRLDRLISEVAREIPSLQVELNNRTVVIDKRLQVLHEDVALIKEYVKLLHTLSHNLVVETTKLRIEHEALRNKVRIMEKDFELLGRRERTLEKDFLK